MSRLPAYFPEPWNSLRDKIAAKSPRDICPIWGNTAENNCWSYTDGDSKYFWSSKAGGAFNITGTLLACIETYVDTETDKIVLSRWIFDQNEKGKIPKISTTNIKEILFAGDISTEEKLHRILLLHDALSERPSIGLWMAGSVIENAYDISYLRSAGANLGNVTDYHWIRDAAVKEELLQSHNHNGCNYLRLTPKGLAQLSLSNRKSMSEQCFVAMWFSNDMDKVYDNAISLAVRHCGYVPYRVDRDKSHSDQITNKILAEIKSSKFLIADFTHGGDGARGGVYFEAGYALGLGIPVLWLIRKDDVSKMHFDTNHYPHIVWENEAQLKEELEAAILAHQQIGKGPL